MHIKLSKKQEISTDTGELETWYYIMADSSPLLATKEQEKADRYYESLKTFYCTHKSLDAVTEIIKEATI